MIRVIRMVIIIIILAGNSCKYYYAKVTQATVQKWTSDVNQITI